MMPSRNSVVVWCSATAPAPAAATSPLMLRPSPGWIRLPTTRPMTSAKVDIVTK